MRKNEERTETLWKERKKGRRDEISDTKRE